jgi:hypothetical protein
LRRTVSDKIADDYYAGRDADADLQRLLRAGFDFRDNSDDVERRLDGTFGVLLVRAGKPKKGQHPIAHELGDEAIIARHCAGAGVLIGSNDLAHILGIEPR